MTEKRGATRLVNRLVRGAVKLIRDNISTVFSVNNAAGGRIGGISL